ncbi:hypothetical protein, partial [Salmonella enterica]|uniref:hypothetical protein n=1 Tax=Salmonella enterica TaxID=28901 RepID=UPI0015E82775
MFKPIRQRGHFAEFKTSIGGEARTQRRTVSPDKFSSQPGVNSVPIVPEIKEKNVILAAPGAQTEFVGFGGPTTSFKRNEMDFALKKNHP